MPSKVLEQHIAVFGESGSGKTVMLSSFYGSEKEPQNIKRGAFNLVAENQSQGTRLHQNYLGMKKSGTVPDQNRFAATSYSFLLRLKGESPNNPLKGKPFDSLRLVWHDYPGEWFEQEVSGPEEEKRRVDTFRALLSSNVALLLVDGQKLLDHSGEEERYLKSLLGNFHNSLLTLKDDLLVDGQPLVTFPRIWVIALTKADVFTNLDVHDFRDIVIEKVGAELNELRSVLAQFIESDVALSVGEDFVLTSSAKFSPGSIEVTKRIGIDLILPMAAVLPLERHIRWAQTGKVTRRVAMELMSGAELIASGLGIAGKIATTLMGKSNKVAFFAGQALSRLAPSLEDAAKMAGEKLEAVDAAAATKRENLAATLASFREDLDAAEASAILLRSAE